MNCNLLGEFRLFSNTTKAIFQYKFWLNMCVGIRVNMDIHRKKIREKNEGISYVESTLRAYLLLIVLNTLIKKKNHKFRKNFQ